MKAKRPYSRCTQLNQNQIAEISERLNKGESIYSLSVEFKTSTDVLFNHWKNYLKSKQ